MSFQFATPHCFYYFFFSTAPRTTYNSAASRLAVSNSGEVEPAEIVLEREGVRAGRTRKIFDPSSEPALVRERAVRRSATPSPVHDAARPSKHSVGASSWLNKSTSCWTTYKYRRESEQAIIVCYKLRVADDTLESGSSAKRSLTSGVHWPQ